MWIQHIPPEQAEGALADIYRRSAGPTGQVDQILQAHSLRPYTLHGHMALYRSVLHHPAKTVEAWFLEALGVWVSRLNRCDYCDHHHDAGMARLLNDPQRTQQIRQALATTIYQPAFSAREAAALDYAEKLTQNPADLSAADIQQLRDSGWDDAQILEINQVCAYFAYANRTVLGLGVTPAGESLGEHPQPEA